jgi:hypothetical protein
MQICGNGAVFIILQKSMSIAACRSEKTRPRFREAWALLADFSVLNALLQGVHHKIVEPLKIEGPMIDLGLADITASVHIEFVLAIQADIDVGMVKIGSILYGILDDLFANVANQVFHGFTPFILSVANCTQCPAYCRARFWENAGISPKGKRSRFWPASRRPITPRPGGAPAFCRRAE